MGIVFFVFFSPLKEALNQRELVTALDECEGLFNRKTVTLFCSFELQDNFYSPKEIQCSVN